MVFEYDKNGVFREEEKIYYLVLGGGSSFREHTQIPSFIFTPPPNIHTHTHTYI